MDEVDGRLGCQLSTASVVEAVDVDVHWLTAERGVSKFFLVVLVDLRSIVGSRCWPMK